MTLTNLTEIATQVESDLSDFYGFECLIPTSQCLEYMEHIEGTPYHDTLKNSGISSQRAATLFQYDDEYLDICILISREISQKLSDQNPYQEINNHNLDSFAALVEEVSHFHYITNKINSNQPISLLELELQGEIDKLLCCAIWLFRQSGHSHFYHLAGIFGSQFHICNQVTSERYLEAHKLANQLWGKIRAEHPSIDPLFDIHVQSKLKSLYQNDWHQKVSFIKQRS